MIDQADDLRKLITATARPGLPVPGTPVASALLADTPVAGTPVAGTPVAGTLLSGTPVNYDRAESDPARKARVFSITSGKGGVGKTNITVNLAYVLKQMDKSVLIIDADLGLANINILLGISSQWTLQHVIRQEKSISEVISTSPDGLKILPASSGLEEMTRLSAAQKLYFKSQLDLLDHKFDFILIDTAAGISSNVMAFNQMAQEVIVILSPDPTSLADAYATIKVLATKYGVTQFNIITNNTQNALHGKDLFQKLQKICQRFLNIPIQHLGTLSADPKLVQASRNQQIVVKEYPKAKISQEIQKVAESVGGIPYDPWSNKNINFLLNNVLNLGQERGTR